MNIQELASEIPVQGEYSLEGVDFITNGDQYLTFSLDKELYGVDILSVEEIRSWEIPTIIPNAPRYVKGVINMRGVIVPIIDLRLKFGIGDAVYSELTVVIVLKVEHSKGVRTIGFVVDSVSDVLDADKGDIKPAPSIGGKVPKIFVDGLVNVGDRVVTLLNVSTLQQIEPHKN